MPTVPMRACGRSVSRCRRPWSSPSTRNMPTKPPKVANYAMQGLTAGASLDPTWKGAALALTGACPSPSAHVETSRRYRAQGVSATRSQNQVETKSACCSMMSQLHCEHVS